MTKLSPDEDRCARAVLALLLGRHNCAAHLGRGPKEGGVSWSVIREATGADTALLRALLGAGLVKATDGQAPAGGPQPQSRFALTEAGCHTAWWQMAPPPVGTRPAAQNGHRPSGAGEKPRWDRAARTLWFGGKVVTRFTRGARNQERVLEAFEELAWPARIDDPLPPEAGDDTVTRLRDTVRNLAARLRGTPLCFRPDAEGKAVFWSAGGC